MRFAHRLKSLARVSVLSSVTLLALFSSGCASSSKLNNPQGLLTLPSTVTSEAQTASLLDTARQDWMGVRYRFGGTTRSGVDCSAFVRAIYEDAFQVSLPRSTRDQVHEGREVRKADLQAGDLVFFRTGRTRRHVGVYLGEGRFVHASSSNGVVVSRLDETYYQRTYWTSRRLLPTFADAPEAEALAAHPPAAVTPKPPQPVPAPAEAPSARPTPSRPGW